MIYALFIGLIFCHFLADFTHLSTNWMLSAKKLGTPLFPIFCHAATHAVMQVFFIYVWVSLLINRICPFYSFFYKVFLFQIITHFLIDVWKGKMNKWFTLLQSPANKWHWIVFGFDQFLHTTIIYFTYEYILNL